MRHTRGTHNTHSPFNMTWDGVTNDNFPHIGDPIPFPDPGTVPYRPYIPPPIYPDLGPYPWRNPNIWPDTTTGTGVELTTAICTPNVAKVLTFGEFDYFGVTEADFLRRCADIAGEDGEVVVGLRGNADAAINCGNSYNNRYVVLDSCAFVDRISRLEDEGKLLIEQEKPDFIVMPGDLATVPCNDLFGVSITTLDEMGIAVVFTPTRFDKYQSDTVPNTPPTEPPSPELLHG